MSFDTQNVLFLEFVQSSLYKLTRIKPCIVQNERFCLVDSLIPLRDIKNAYISSEGYLRLSFEFKKGIIKV